MKKPLSEKFKQAVDDAKNSKLGKKVIENKGIVAGAVVNAATTAYAFRKGGTKFGLATAAGSLVWTGLSTLYFKTLKDQEAEEQAKAERDARAAEPVADAFSSISKKPKNPEATPSESEAKAEGEAKPKRARRAKKDKGADPQP